MSNEQTPHDSRPESGAPRDSVRAVFFERLIDQLAPGPDTVAPELRAARRLCGRWLLLRRAARGLARSAVAERTGLSEGAIELLEQGLLGPDAGTDEGWWRLGLVLEGRQEHDMARIVAALAIARGREAAPDGVLLAGFEAEVAVPAEEQRQAPLTLADMAVELIDILAAVEALGGAATAYRVKKRIAEQGGRSWNSADLPQTMAVLVREELITRAETRPASYALTEAGVALLALHEERQRAIDAEQRAREALARVDTRLGDLFGRLRPLNG